MRLVACRIHLVDRLCAARVIHTAQDVTRQPESREGAPRVAAARLAPPPAHERAEKMRRWREMEAKRDEALEGGRPLPGIPGADTRVNGDATWAAQNETSITADPTNPDRLIAAWNDFHITAWSQYTTIGYGWSEDGGETWQSDRVRFSSIPADQSLGDPSVVFDRHGIAYLGVLAYLDPVPGIYVARSPDGRRHLFGADSHRGRHDRQALSRGRPERTSIRYRAASRGRSACACATHH